MQHCPSRGDGLPSAQDVIRFLEAEGVRHGLGKHIKLIEARQEDFTIEQIAWIFDQCSRAPTVSAAGRNDSEGAAEVPVGTKLVQLFSNFVCERTTDLSPQSITTFVVALTSQALRMDEFWLFMMAKRIEDIAATFTADQIVTIAKRFADKGLEDDEFFDALTKRILASPGEFGPAHLSSFLASCAKVRYLHDDLVSLAYPLFNDSNVVAKMDAASLVEVVTAAGYLDRRADFRPAPCIARVLAAQPDSVALSPDFLMGLLLACICVRQSRALRLSLLPVVLSALRGRGGGGPFRVNKGHRRDQASLVRRLLLLSWSAAYGVPRGDSWPLSVLRQLFSTLTTMQERHPVSARDAYEPTPSSFHLEVVAVLRLLKVDHQLERPHAPFQLDILIQPEQLRSGFACAPQQ